MKISETLEEFKTHRGMHATFRMVACLGLLSRADFKSQLREYCYMRNIKLDMTEMGGWFVQKVGIRCEGTVEDLEPLLNWFQRIGMDK